MTLLFIDEKIRDLLVKEEKIATDCSFGALLLRFPGRLSALL